MGKGHQGQGVSEVNTHGNYSWEEVKEHSTKADKWVVIEDGVYDVSQWVKRHPGGYKVLSHYAGEDATDAFVAFHPDKSVVRKYLKPLRVGSLSSEDAVKATIVSDMRDLRSKAEEMDLFTPNLWFYAAHLAHIVALEVLGWMVLWYYGTTWLPLLITAALLTTSQAQAGWLQHDLGHLSVFRRSRWNHWLHYFVIGGMKAASAHWWNYRHFQHHAKPNVVKKDPDISMPYLFLFGDKMPVKWASSKRGFMPYNYQQSYFFLIGPPLLLPVYFHVENLYHVFYKGIWTDLAWTVIFFVRLFVTYGPLLGGLGAFGLYMFVRFLESHWFVWVTQMNHIPMEVDTDNQRDWLTMQLQATCNVHPSFFNDWFTGHLNYQIEHHLFPTMPRHNFYKIMPDVKSLCSKYGLNYQSKTLLGAFADIVHSLKSSGQLWYDAYHHA
ncbi:fatty acid desaturase 2-like [Patiria miniata]|uniref:Cytochrome b5 heme-binding domain-containing protein n=1 Tax=Patiria miniata TaxID=46514 RepID=A0A914B6W8_PATMI|nr:fatty acid desaturase 2-like [Patiria miniata]XP_038071949.1 fatty acid desaturase 2-like [Patiria miniata]XP_038071950.1 fatty acid desaturase 2-like [Patiria miniata]XP_038071951.1 fatty acid desaturase 2-like [Patiria miniata]